MPTLDKESLTALGEVIIKGGAVLVIAALFGAHIYDSSLTIRDANQRFVNAVNAQTVAMNALSQRLDFFVNVCLDVKPDARREMKDAERTGQLRSPGVAGFDRDQSPRSLPGESGNGQGNSFTTAHK